MTTYRRFGEGPHKVLGLHGWFGDAGAWDTLTRNLDGTAHSYVFVDYRGYGASKSVPGAHTMDEIASDALAVVDGLDWDTFSVMGHSMGGMAAQRVLADAPDRVRSLLCLNPVPASGSPMDDATWDLFSGAATDPAKRYAIIDMTTGNRLSATWVQRMVDYSLEHSTPEAFGAYAKAWVWTDFAEEVDGYELPVLAVVGEHDKAITAEVMEATFAQVYPNCTVEVMPNAGHYPMEETPVALATWIEAFLAEVDGP